MANIYEGRICVITGAASGIGRALVVKLASVDAVLAISDVNAEGLAETVKLAGLENTNRVLVDTLDVGNADAIAAYGDHVEQGLGSADYVFNVAGITRVGRFDETPLSSMETIMNINYWGVVRMSKAFLPQLKKTKGGLVNISSIFGIIGYPGQTHYCASKFAVRGFSETLAQEMEEFGVRVSSVHPGGVKTNIARNAEVDTLPTDMTKEQMNANFDEAAITSAEDAAQIILDGTAKGARRILIGKDAKMVTLVQRLFPIKYAKVLEKLMGRKILDE